MKEQTFAAVDLGAESGRVVAGHFDGAKLRLEEIHRFANTPARVLDSLQWDVLRLWNDIGDGLGKLGARKGEVIGIGVDTWGVDFGLLDARDQLLGNPVHYRDRRNDGMMEAACQILGRETIFDATGLQFMPFNTLFQLLALKRQNSPQLDAAQTLLFIPDLLHFWLSGLKTSEYSIASTSQMLDARTRQWSKSLLDGLDLPSKVLCDPIAPGTTIGPLHSSIAARSGLAQSTLVIAPGSHDTASAIVAVPATGADWAYLSSGTWSLMGIELEQPLINARVSQLNFTNEGGVGKRIRFLKNIAGLWLVQECRRSWLREGKEYSYAELTQLASDAVPFQSIVEPDDASFAAPDDMPRALSEFCARSGQSAPADAGATIRLCLESLALKYRWTLERLEELRGAPLKTLYIVGGGTQNELLSQLTADCIGRPVVTGPVEATAAGNILTQLMGRGELKNLDEMRAIVRASFELKSFEPTQSTLGAWDAAYEKFLKML